MKPWILITGASSGIGKVTAQWLDAQGYPLVLTGRSLEKLQHFQRTLKEESFIYTMDLCDLVNIGSIFEFCRQQKVKLAGMVHCAGIGHNIPVRNNRVEDMQDIMTTNYFSFVELVKYFCSRKNSEDEASVVAISSISPLTCYAGACNYAASKSAIDTAVKVMSKEYLKRKIRVNAILPAYVNTPLGPAEDDPVYLAQQPLGIIKAEYIAYMVEFLLSEKSKYMTGTLIPISGGMSY